MIRNTFDQMTCCMHYGIINTVKIDGCDYLCEDNAFPRTDSNDLLTT